MSLWQTVVIWLGWGVAAFATALCIVVIGYLIRVALAQRETTP